MKSRFTIFSIVTVVTCLTAFKSFNKPRVATHVKRANPVGDVYILIDKSDYALKVYDEEGWYATYPVVFGNKDLSDKLYEGDKRTPEGTFKIIYKKDHNKWHRMLMLDYPTPASWEKFRDRKASGSIPKSAKIGGGIGIHGTWPNDNIVVDDYTNWTNGCISLKNNDLDELDPFLPVGTKVIIQR